ncbi:MAG: IS3 family transposase [Bacillota bacterium]|nr:IS3 family transposase [Bacillota bacterium]
MLCDIACISRSAFYKFKHKNPCTLTDIDDKIIDIYNKSNKRAGYRTIKMRLKSVYGLTVNHKKVQRVMQKCGLKSVVRPKRKKIKEDLYIKPNILNRDFKAAKPNEKYATDITYIPTQSKMMYLSTIIDLYDNYPVVWNLSDNQNKSLSLDTIKMLANKVDLSGAIIHSDQGIHYTNKDYTSYLKTLGVNQSMSRKGNCWDNACAESFFSQYKCECIYLYKNRIKTPFDVMEITEEYFDYYINYRPQKRLDGLTPGEYRLTYAKS